MNKFSQNSLDKLSTCHPDLQLLFNEVIKKHDCMIICGHRNKADQDQAYKTKHSKTPWPESAHNSLPSWAADVIPYPLSDWNDKLLFKTFSDIVKETAKELGIEIMWGGDFKSFYDGPHYELVHKLAA